MRIAAIAARNPLKSIGRERGVRRRGIVRAAACEARVLILLLLLLLLLMLMLMLMLLLLQV